MRKELYTTDELAKRWSMRPTTLERWRSMSIGPKYAKLGEHTSRVLYRIEDIEKYERTHVIQPEGKK